MIGRFKYYALKWKYRHNANVFIMRDGRVSGISDDLPGADVMKLSKALWPEERGRIRSRYELRIWLNEKTGLDVPNCVYPWPQWLPRLREMAKERGIEA